ncbi:MAG: FAD-binding oxidoreductase [Gammaproteobacteria bacterium]|nr:MAG: FAD-binding oxidoreductase [Gammaproteobacteria bacterium]
MAIPPGVSERDFSLALSEFAGAVGREWVYTSAADMDLYRDAYSPYQGESEDRAPSAAVAPDRVEQVQQIVRIANRYRIPLWTISTGRNLGYGGSSPTLSGSVILDLKRMNRILEVNDKTHYAVVEPGVSYFDLYRHIQERGLKVWIDPADPGWGSPLANALERGGGRTPMRDHWNAVCGLEVVLPDGELLRTGMGALPGAEVWHQYKYGFGPIVDGLFSQSNFGIVTRMGIWLMPSPEAYRDGRVMVPRHDDLVPFLEHYAYLMNSDILRGTMLLDSPLLNYHASQGGSFFDMPGGPSIAELDGLARDRNLPYWGAEFRFWGPPKLIEAQWEYVKERYSTIPGAMFTEGRNYVFPTEIDSADATLPVALGIPTLGVFGLLQGGGHLGFSPIIPMTGEAVFKAQRVFGQLYAEMNLPAGNQFFALPWSYSPRALVLLFGIPLSADIEQNRNGRRIFERMVEASAANGWGEYRTHVAFMDHVADTYSFNDHAMRRLHERLKDLLDPNGVLSPGKSGIWPRHMREG